MAPLRTGASGIAAGAAHVDEFQCTDRLQIPARVVLHAGGSSDEERSPVRQLVVVGDPADLRQVRRTIGVP